MILAQIAVVSSLNTDIVPTILFCSVVKVHLQLRGFTTHIEGEQAEMARQTACSEAGEVSAVERVRQSAVFVLVLSPGSLDPCLAPSASADCMYRVRGARAVRVHVHMHTHTHMYSLMFTHAHV